MLTKLSFLPNHTYEDKLRQMAEFIGASSVDNSGVRFNLTFTEPTEVRVNAKTVKETTELNDVGFFTTGDGTLCYTKSKGFRVHGYPVTSEYMDPEKIESIGIMEVNETLNMKRRAKSLAKQIPDGGLTTVKEKLENSPLESYPDSNFRPIYYAVRFPESVRDQLREELAEAFANRSEYTYEYKANSGRGNARDLKIALKEIDGQYGGVLTSYYPGTLNGDEFLILSEKVAFFVEKD